MSGKRGTGAGPASYVEARRAARRRRAWLLAAAAPFVLVLGVLVAKFVTLTLSTDRAEAQYADSRYAQAAATYGSQTWLNIIDPWKVYYNQGTAELRSTMDGAKLDAAHRAPTIDDAIDTLEQAYSLTKSENAATQCLVQTNLALSYEVAGDKQVDVIVTAEADRDALLAAVRDREKGNSYNEDLVDEYTGLLEKDPTEAALDTYVEAARTKAIESYRAAIDARERPGCPQSSEEDQEGNEDAKERVKQKLSDGGGGGDQEEEDPDADPTPSPSPSPDPSQDPDEADRQEQLQELNDQAARDAYEEQQNIEDTYGDRDGEWVEKKW